PPARREHAAGAGEGGGGRGGAGAAVPAAAITVTDTATNRQRVVTSSREGVYAATGLTPGSYRVDAALAGFKPLRRTGIRLATGVTAQLDLELQVGDLREQVIVAGDTPALRTATAGLGAVIEH